MNATIQARASSIEARKKLMDELKTVSGEVASLEEPGGAKATATGNPWAAVGLGAAAGLLLGLLLSRKK